MFEPMSLGISVFNRILDQIQEEDRRKHEQKLQEFSVIADSSLRDQLAAELLMDRFLAPIDKAQFQIRDAGNHAQYMAEVVGYHYADHGLTQEQASSLSSQFRFLAQHLIEANSLHNLKLLYKAATLFADEISVFKHPNRKYSIEREVRHGILYRLNDCIASYENFQRRAALFESNNLGK